jgi:fermentation-respiration switch protein FrsA (DUF1100 family)
VKLWLKLALAFVLLIILSFLGISAFLGYSMTRVERVAIEDDPGLRGLDYEDVSFTSLDKNLTLRGWYLPGDVDRPVIIMLHGEKEHRADESIGMLDLAAVLVERGYNVLMFDMRGHGESGGSMMSAGYHEKKDLLGAVDYLRGRGLGRIGVLGFSMGAATALMAATESDDIGAVVADSSFADLEDIMGPEFSKRTKFPRFFLPPLLFMVKVMYGVDFTAVAPVEAVSEAPSTPVFIIHGELDDVIPVEHAHRLKEASQHPQSRLWLIPSAEHVRAYVDHPREYVDRVVAFFDEALR